MISLSYSNSRVCTHTRSITSVPCRASEGLHDLHKTSAQALTFVSSDSSSKRTSIVGGSYLCGPVMRRNPAGKALCTGGVATYGENVVEDQSHSHATEDKVGVLLLNLGGPETLHDVQPFLFNLFADPVCQVSFYSFHFCYCYHYFFSFIFACFKYSVMVINFIF